MFCVILFVLDISLHEREVLGRKFGSLFPQLLLLPRHVRTRHARRVPVAVTGGLGRSHPVPVIGDHLLAVPPVAGLEGVHRVAELLEHDVRVQTVGGGPAGEIATPQHRVEASRRGPQIGHVVVLVRGHHLLIQIHPLIQQS